MKEVENVKVDNVAISGDDKKKIVTQLGRIMISKQLAGSENLADILFIYDTSSDVIIETIISVSSVVNIDGEVTPSSVCFNVIKLCMNLLQKALSSNLLNFKNTQ